MTSSFYRAFEEKYRGERDLIKSRLKVYLPFIEPLKETYPTGEALDLGCGRGEWLELLREFGVNAHGIDIDDGMLVTCRDLDLSVETGDAIAFLKGLDNESKIVISGFHIAEHLEFADLQALVQESLRVLKPGCLLILETPNPENIVVGSSDFYLDPTHQRPIPPGLLSFLPEYYGFGQVKILRLQESKALLNGNHLNLLSVLSGVSPDYAVVAQKKANHKISDLTSKAFQREYGLTLEQLAMSYHQQTEVIQHQLEVALQENQRQCRQFEVALQENQRQCRQFEVVLQENQRQCRQFEDMALSLLNSKSMRFTQPLRWLGKYFGESKAVVLSKTQTYKSNIAKPVSRSAHQLVQAVNSHPYIRSQCVSLSKKIGIHTHLKPIYLRLYKRYLMYISEYQGSVQDFNGDPVLELSVLENKKGKLSTEQILERIRQETSGFNEGDV